MRERIGITTGYVLRDLAAPKTASLLFDRLVVFGLSSVLDQQQRGWWARSEANRDLAQWLIDEGVLLEERVTFEGALPEEWADRQSAQALPAIITDYHQQGKPIARYRWEMPVLGGGVNGELDDWRYAALAIAEQGGDRSRIAAYWASAIPIYLGISPGPLYSTCREVAGALQAQANCVTAIFGQDQRWDGRWGDDTAMEIVLQAFPHIDDQTPWEAILEFRADDDARNKRYRLQDWLNRVGREESNPREFAEHLQVMIADYEDHMRLHRLKTHRGMLETMVVSAAEIAENFVKFQWGKAAKALFTISSRRIHLHEAERSAPNRDIAYIALSHRRFSISGER